MDTESILWNHWYEKDKEGWYRVNIPIVENPPNDIEKYQEIIFWIYNNIDGFIRHSRWQITSEEFQFKFRYERDMLMFTLRWS